MADYAVNKMLNVSGGKRVWTLDDVKEMFEKYGCKKPEKATWGDCHYVFAMFFADQWSKGIDNEQKLSKATVAYLEDPDAPEGVAFVRYIAVVDFIGEKINWRDMF